MTEPSQQTPSCYLTVKNFAAKHGQFISESGLRNLIFHAEKNGFAGAITRLGRRVLINEVEFFRRLQQVAK